MARKCRYVKCNEIVEAAGLAGASQLYCCPSCKAAQAIYLQKERRDENAAMRAQEAVLRKKGKSQIEPWMLVRGDISIY